MTLDVVGERKKSSYVNLAFEPLRSVLTDGLVEICINPDGAVWREERGDAFMKKGKLTLAPRQVRDIGLQIAAEGGVRISEKHPVGSVSINFQDWLVRAQVVQSPAVRQGDSISLRFFKPDTALIVPGYLNGVPVDASAMRRELNRRVAEMAVGDLEAALMLCVTEKLNVVVSGGTSSGKTTVARWLISHVPDEERIITIEDVPDLMPAQPNKVMLVSNRTDEHRSPDRLLQACLRMRPDRIILSEVTGSDAYTFLKAINTGHGGSITTIHADTAELAIDRLAQTALEANSHMTYRDMIAYVKRSIDVIVHVGKEGGRRGVLQVFLPDNFHITEGE